jgi:polyferredoxin
MTMSRHSADLLSLTFGLLFAAVGLVLLSGSGGALSLAWVGPLTAIALGALLFLAARSTRSAPDEAPVEE